MFKCLSVTLAVVFSLPLVAAEIPKSVRGSASASLVEVPVTVVDSDGKAVPGLTLGDFDLRDNGKPVLLNAVDVTTFAAASSVRAEAAPIAVAPAARRRFLLLFDLSFSSPIKLGRVREAAIRFVNERTTPEDLIAVATITAEKGVNMLITFTSDRRQLDEAVSTLGVTNQGMLAPDPLKLTRLLNVRDSTSLGEGGQGSGTSKDLAIDEIRQLSDRVKQHDDNYSRGRITSLLRSFGSLARMLEAVPGRKQVIYFSEGFDMRLLQGSSDDFDQAKKSSEAAIKGSLWEIDSEERFGNSSLQTTMGTILENFKRYDCVIHTVDLSGLSNASAGLGATDRMGSGNGRAALSAIAEGTGGQAFRNANDFGDELARLMEQQRIVYVLTFPPQDTGHPGKLHELKVRVNRKGVRVFARSAYVEPRPFSASSSVEKSLSAADMLAAEVPVSGIPVQMFAYPIPSTAPARVAVFVFVPSLPVAPKPGENVPLEFYLYAFGADGKIADFATTQGALDSTKLEQPLNSSGVTLYSSLRLSPGEYRVRSLVRNSQTGLAGLAALSVHVPGETEKKALLLAPVFVGPESRGVMLRATSAQSSFSPVDSYPFVAGKSFVPKVPAEYPAGSEIPLCLYAYHLGPSGSNPSLSVWGDILDASGKTVGEASLVAGAHSRPDDSERSTLLVTLKTQGLSAGEYRLRMVLNREGGEPLESTAEFLLN